MIGLLDHSEFFESDVGGDPVFWQHLFWFFGHPEVWFTIPLWCLVIATGIWQSLRFWRVGNAVASTAIAVSAVLWTATYIWLFLTVQAGFVNGELDSTSLAAFQVMEWSLLLMAGISTGLFIKTIVKARKNT